MKPLKHESMPETPCDMRYTKLTNPQSYCGDKRKGEKYHKKRKVDHSEIG